MSKPGKMYIGIDVCEAARRRTAWVFDNHKNVVSLISGGKDGHVVFELAYAEAVRRGRPLHVAFLDQELECQATIDVISENMRRPGVIPLWYQCPLRDEYHISMHGGLFQAWEPGKEWMRPKDPLAIHEAPDGFPDGPNRAGGITERDSWTRWRDWLAGIMGAGTALLVGDRADETNTRYFLVTREGSYPGVRWSKSFGVAAPSVYPVYDWSVEDVWAFMAREKVTYNRIYDHYHRIGMAPSKQRAGYLMSRNSFKRMADVQVFEPATYDRLVARTDGLAGIAAEYGREGSMFFAAKVLPSGYPTWLAYRDFLMSELPPDDRTVFAVRFARGAATEAVHRLQVRQLLSRDREGFHSLKPHAGAMAAAKDLMLSQL